ncbi:uncharacterized protein N7496_009207 [Penicillium cataractarum]|uniref:Zn(2)-C6 fungal-type domain-containing protein n=1 Tax=Penicillium cataractarum TaxID=2100454 RepID=A0A9W9RQP4_9EURO|nr:uncharacterized protein N7496_009207 [Penicillium cataractarum]KAJ5363494.1 hypothetical protein N7496_009207 [Penicillium cataractarum]
MPRRKAADRTGQVKTRSRSGCRECRASRVRCDTKKPACTRCLEKGLPCSTNLVLKWESEFVSRGMAFGRAGVWSKSRTDASPASGSSASSPAFSVDDMREWCALPAIHPWAFINSGMATFENPDQIDLALNEQLALVPIRNHDAVSVAGDALADHSAFGFYSIRNLGGLATALNPGPTPALSLFPGISEIGHTELFDYYLRQVCPRTTASSTLSSPFASVILPFSVSASPTLFKAIQSLAACHWARRDPSYSTLGLRLKSETLRDLRRRLSYEGSATCCTDPEVLLVMMMLCLYEILDKCDEHWTIHLKGAKDLIRLRRQRVDAVFDPVTTFAEHFFAFQDVMGRTACGEEVLFGSDYWKTDDQHIDLWMGCSPELVAILSSITELSRARRQLQSSNSSSLFSVRAASLEHQLEYLIQEVGEGDDDILASVAEAKRLAALLYLHCALYGASPTTPLVVNYVHQILRLVSDLLERGSMASVMWPVFVAAVELDPSRDELWSGPDGQPVSGRSVVLQALASMADSTISNIARTRAVIIQAWQARDQDLLKPPQMELNDWEKYVAPISTSMSLA